MSKTCFYCDDEAGFVCDYHIKKMAEEKLRRLNGNAPLMLEALKNIVAESETGFVPSSSKDRMVEIAQATIDAVEGEVEK